MDYGGPHENGTIHLVPIANPQPAGGIVVSSANVKSEPQNPQTSVHVQMPNVQYIQEPGGVSVSKLYCTLTLLLIQVNVIEPVPGSEGVSIVNWPDGQIAEGGQFVGYQTPVRFIAHDPNYSQPDGFNMVPNPGPQHAGPFSITSLMSPHMLNQVHPVSNSNISKKIQHKKIFTKA